MVFHNLWKEKMVIGEQRAKKVRKYKDFFKRCVENHVENVDKNLIFFHKNLWKRKTKKKSPFLGIFGKTLVGNFDISKDIIFGKES